jgi:hypothetical protein
MRRSRVSEYPYKAKDRIEALIASLRTMAERDPEQEVQGMALPVLDAVLQAVRSPRPSWMTRQF